MASFDLDLYTPTDPAKMIREVINIHKNNLHHYRNHPFRLYTGEQLDDMVESIGANGILVPLIVRPMPHPEGAVSHILDDRANQEYEILSGHNRKESGEDAGLDYMPCIVLKGLTEEEAYIIVTESNLYQRSIGDLCHSERALVLATHYDAIKELGKPSDLVLRLENELKNIDSEADKPHHNQLSDEMYHDDTKGENGMDRLKTAGEKYGLSKVTVARYIRINGLIQPLKEVLDNHKMTLMAGVSLSYIAIPEQQVLFDYILENDVAIKVTHADKLRRLYNDRKFTVQNIEKIFLGKKVGAKPKAKSAFTIKRKSIAGFFPKDEKDDVIEQTIIEALGFYRQHQNRQQKTDIVDIDNGDNIEVAVATLHG